MDDLIVGIGLVFVLEGLLYAVSPKTMKEMMQQMCTMEEGALRKAGLAALCFGVIIVWLVRG